MSRITASARGSASIGSSVRRDRREPLLAAQPLHFGEALGMARGNHEQRIAASRPQPVERAHHRLFLTLERAAGDEHRAIRRHAEEAQHPLAAAARRRDHFERVELQAAGDRDARRIGAKRHQAPRGLVALDAEAVDVGEDAAEERTDQPVPRKRSIRDAAVHQHGLDAAAPALAQQVRPDLGFDHHEEPRLHAVQRAPHRERPVEREIEHAVDVG